MSEITIVSGGQTGADRGALDAALAKRVPCGGWCPENRMAEDGPIPDHYPVVVLPGSGYRQRTRQNVIDSDATVILFFDDIEPSSGTQLTVDECVKAARPHLLIDGKLSSIEQAAGDLLRFCVANGVRRLNVAGPRASGEPAIHAYTQSVIERFIDLWQAR